MGKLLKVWLDELLEEGAPWFDHPKSIAGEQKGFKNNFKKDKSPVRLLHVMHAFNHAVQYRIAIPQWVIKELDKRLDKYRPLPKQTEGTEWLTSVEVMNRWRINDLTLAKHVSSGELGYYIRSGKWLSEEAQAVRENGKVIYQGWTWIDREEISFDRISENSEDLAFSMEDVIEFEKKHEIKIKPEAQKKNVADNRLERNGDTWNISFGGENTTINHSKGIYDIACLLNNKPHTVDVVDLYNAKANPITDSTAIRLSKMTQEELEKHNLTKGFPEGRTTVKSTSEGDGADKRKMLRDCLMELEKAKAENNSPLIHELEEEKSELIAELSGKAKGKTEELARKAVARRIKTAIKKIKLNNKPLGDHLSDTVKTGKYCSYEPKEEISWDIRI